MDTNNFQQNLMNDVRKPNRPKKNCYFKKDRHQKVFREQTKTSHNPSFHSERQNKTNRNDLEI